MTFSPKGETSGVIPWYFKGAYSTVDGGHVRATYIRNTSPFKMKLSPRPSLISVALKVQSTVAVGERVRRSVIISSGEKEHIIAKIQAKVVTDNGDVAKVKWIEPIPEVIPSSETSVPENSDSGEKNKDENDTIEDLHIESLQSIPKELEIQVPSVNASTNSITLEFFISYYTAADGDEMLIKDVVVRKIEVVKPFAVYSNLNPRVHPTAWPSLFNPDISDNLVLSPRIWKRWEFTHSLLCLIGTDSPGPVEVVRTELILNPGSEAVCDIVRHHDCKGKIMKHNDNGNFSFVIDTARKSQDQEIRSVILDPILKIYWRRRRVVSPPPTDGKKKTRNWGNDNSQPQQVEMNIHEAEDSDIINEFILPPLRLSLNLIEPRLIVTMARATIGKKKRYTKKVSNTISVTDHSGEEEIQEKDVMKSRAIKLRYYIENATAHMLTYSVTMGASDSFAYQGPKQLTVRMLPFTRRGIEYILYPLGRGQLLVPPLRVFDVNYRKTLGPVPASSNLKAEKNRLVITC